MKARVYVTLKPSVFDPQGERRGPRTHVDGLRRREGCAAGEVLRGRARWRRSSDAPSRVTEMADKLLANPVIESYRVEIL